MQQPSSSSSARSRSWSWGSGAWATAPPLLSSRQLKPRHERSRSTTATYHSPLASDSEQSHGGDMTTEQAPVVEELHRPATEAEAEGEAARPAPDQEPPAASDSGADAGMQRVVRRLEREAAAAKQTEMKMLESLVRQTKELEQAKIALEEARLELAALRQQQQQQDQGQGGAAAAPQQQQWSVMDLMFGGVDEEINGLRARLRAASQAEERSRKAADDLTAALSAVTMEAKQVKAWLADAQADLEAANAEVDRLGALLRAAEAELWAANEQADAVTAEWKDAAAGWRAREKALVARARAAEEDAAAARREAADLAGARRDLGDECDALRRALERAAEDASAAAEALDLVTGENADLRDDAAEKERALEDLRRQNEALKSSEAAARSRAEQLEAQLLAAKAKPPAADDDGAAIGKAAAAAPEIPLVEKWRREAAQGKLGAAAFLDSGRVIPGRRDRMFASLSNLAELKSAAAAAAMDDYDYEFDHFDVAGQYGVGGATEHAMKHKKRRSILRKFGDLFRRRSMYKSNLAPELHNHY